MSDFHVLLGCSLFTPQLLHSIHPANVLFEVHCSSFLFLLKNTEFSEKKRTTKETNHEECSHRDKKDIEPKGEKERKRKKETEQAAIEGLDFRGKIQTIRMKEQKEKKRKEKKRKEKKRKEKKRKEKEEENKREKKGSRGDKRKSLLSFTKNVIQHTRKKKERREWGVFSVRLFVEGEKKYLLPNNEI